MLRFLLRFALCTLVLFLISWGLLGPVIAYEAKTLQPEWLGSPATGLFLILNLPLWIAGKGPAIFHLEGNVRLIALAMNAALYGLLLAAWIGARMDQPKNKPPLRRSVE